jgi:hypothetical protein
MPGAEAFAQTGPSSVIPPYSAVAGFDPAQTAGQEQVLGAVPGQQGVVGSAATGNQFLTSGDVLRPDSNPALAQYMDAATKPLYQNLTEQVLPSVRSGAAAADQFGSSRQGIAEGLAAGRTAQAAGAATADIANKGYQTGLDAMTKGIGLAPQTAQDLALPGLTTSGVGDVRQQLAQAMLGEQAQRYQTTGMWPLLQAQSLAGMAGSLPGAGTTTTASGPTAPSGLQQALGYGAMGTSALSAMLPLLMMSDRRTKKAIKLIGSFRDIPIYLFEYIGSSLPRVGVMADEVPAYARIRMNGIDFVDYGAL